MNKETQRKLWDTQLELTDFLHNFCQKHHLKYYLAFGSLLGAVRHNGFIPWDDDMDVWMPRKDYEIFCKHFPKDNADYFLQTTKTDKHYGRMFAKIRKNNTIFLEDVDKHVEKRHHGVFLDVFPLDNSKTKPSSLVLFKKKIAQFIDGYIVCKRGKVKIKGLRNILKIFPICLLSKVCTHLYKSKQGDCYYASGLQIIPKTYFGEGVLHNFEDRKYFIPEDFD